MNYLMLCLFLGLMGCSNSSSPPSPPAPLSAFAGAIAGPWIVTQGSSPGPQMDAFPQCSSASTCWVSYVQAPLSVALVQGQVYELSYAIVGSDPAFVHDSPNNTADGPATIRLLLEGAGYRAFSAVTQPLAVGGNTLTALISPANWIVVDTSGTTVDGAAAMPALLAHLDNAGYCFGGGYFACHGAAISSGSANFQLNSAVIR